MTTPTTTASTTLEAANDNPGGATRVDVPLAAFVTLLAKAYVAQTRALDRSA
ncbi:hypothetical protein [Paracoccus sp. T5]|uniref:hypothetical protein n=1 Tax=Paracoccus sp. T5 TaxID=3402161 RepID=UPI003AE0C72F